MPGSQTARLRRVVASVTTAEQSAATDRELLRRFVSENDQAAFEVLVTRHTGMVLGVCRRVLSSVQDAEDACQATFLVLASRAKGGRWDESVANWLYTTARKVAHNARVAAVRRAKREAGAAVAGATVPELVEPVDRMTGRELLAALDAALDALPARYREPLVLCYLEGLTRDEAAARLGLPLATLHTRIDRARKRLHNVLTKAGCSLGAGLLALAVSGSAGASAPRLVESILAAASGSVPTAVGELAKGVAVNGAFKKTVLALVAVIGFVGLAAGLSSLGSTSAGGAPPAVLASATPSPAAAEPNNAPPAPPEKAEQSKELPVSGRVFGTDGKPLVGAELFLVGQNAKAKKLGVSESDGRFTVTVPRGEKWLTLVAKADGAGADFVDLGRIPSSTEVELRMAKDRPIRGRIVDTQGKPAAGVTVAVQYVAIYGNNLDPFLAEWKMRTTNSGLPAATRHVGVANAGPFATTTTDKDGRFTISGVGDERLVELRIYGAGIATDELLVVNRAAFDPKPYNQATEEKFARYSDFGFWSLLHGPELAVVAEAEKPIRGVVKDKDTGRPRAGVQVTLSGSPSEKVPHVSSTTDAEGRYEIRGARKAKSYLVRVPSDTITGHVFAFVRGDDTAGYEPVTIDIAMKKGVIVTGRLIDKSTGKPLFGAVYVSGLSGNKFVKEYPEFEMHLPSWFTQPDGTFRCVTIPGATILMGGGQDDLDDIKYKPALPDPKYPQYFKTDRAGSAVFFPPGGGVSSLQGNGAKVLDLKEGTDIVTQDIELELATALPVKVRDADGKPVAGVWATGLGPVERHGAVEVKGDSCAAYHLEGKPRLMVFYEPTKKLFGTLRLKGDEKEPVTVTLGPGGSVKGRVVGEDGKPLAGVAVSLSHRERCADDIRDYVHRAKLVETDADGNFRIDDVIPGVKFEFWCIRGKTRFEPVTKPANQTAEPGKLTDVGELKLKPRPERGGE
jgi:RNA polymerase sigma factor (sigma-70 family)